MEPGEYHEFWSHEDNPIVQSFWCEESSAILMHFGKSLTVLSMRARFSRAVGWVLLVCHSIRNMLFDWTWTQMNELLESWLWCNKSLLNERCWKPPDFNRRLLYRLGNNQSTDSIHWWLIDSLVSIKSIWILLKNQSIQFLVAELIELIDSFGHTEDR